MTVIAKWNGELIADDGIYTDLPITEYHKQCCVGPSVSSSGLRTIDKETPLHFYAKSSLNPDYDPEDDDMAEAQHFRLGRAAHLIALEHPEYTAQVAFRPDEWDSWRTKASQEWRDSTVRAGKLVLDQKERKRVEGMAKALQDHPLYRDGLLAGKIENSLVWQDEKTGIWLKSRPDVIPLDTMCVDLKSANDASPDAVRRAIRDRGYDMQLALTGIAMKKLLGVEVTDYALMVVESKPPFATSVCTLDSELIEFAKRRLRRALNTFALCLAENHWPGYDQFDGQSATLMGVHGKWEMERMDAEAKSGSLKEEF